MAIYSALVHSYHQPPMLSAQSGCHSGTWTNSNGFVFCPGYCSFDSTVSLLSHQITHTQGTCVRQKQTLAKGRITYHRESSDYTCAMQRLVLLITSISVLYFRHIFAISYVSLLLKESHTLQSLCWKSFEQGKKVGKAVCRTLQFTESYRSQV